MNRKSLAIHDGAGRTSVMTDRASATGAFPPCLLSRAGESAVREQCRHLAEWLAAWRSFLVVNEAILLAADVTPREFAALLEVERSDAANGPTIGMLAETLRTRHNTSVGLVTRMCRKGYVRRVRDARDRRHAHVQLTDKGRQLLSSLVSEHWRELQELRMGLTPVTAG